MLFCDTRPRLFDPPGFKVFSLGRLLFICPPTTSYSSKLHIPDPEPSLLIKELDLLGTSGKKPSADPFENLKSLFVDLVGCNG